MEMDEAIIASMNAVNADDLLHDLRPLLVVYKDVRVQRFMGNDTAVSAGVDSTTGVESKDVVFSPEIGIYYRLYKPPNVSPDRKLPLLIYIHGGAFCIGSASSPVYHHYLNTLSLKSNAIIASVDYRLAPEHPLPTAYEDTWSAIQFIAGDSSSDSWLRSHTDFSRAFFAGDSAGANIAHHMAKRIKKEPIPNFTLQGIVLVHPYFWGEDRIGSEIRKGQSREDMITKLWKLTCPETSGSDDPLINPAKDADLAEVSGARVLVLVAEKDMLRDRGVLYKEALVESGWKGVAEVVETAEEDHVFHLMGVSSDKAVEMMNRIVKFLNE